MKIFCAIVHVTEESLGGLLTWAILTLSINFLITIFNLCRNNEPGRLNDLFKLRVYSTIDEI